MTTAEPAARMHPRIRTRRVEVRREAGRRRLRLLVTGAVSVGLLAAGWGATRSPLLDIDGIRVVGADRSDASALLARSGLAEGLPMLDIDSRRAAAAMAHEPWVESALVERRWPGTVVVRIRERTPVAAIAVGDEAVLADRTGRVLARVPAALAGEGVIAVSAEDDTELPSAGVTLDGELHEAVTVAAATIDAVPDRRLALLIDRAGGRGLVLVVDGGVEAVIGGSDDLPAKLTALATLLARVEPSRGSTIDLRVPSAPVLTRG